MNRAANNSDSSMAACVGIEKFSVKFTWNCERGKQYNRDGKTWSEPFWSLNNAEMKWVLAYSLNRHGSSEIWLSLKSSHTLPIDIHYNVTSTRADYSTKIDKESNQKAQFTDNNQLKRVLYVISSTPKQIQIDFQVFVQVLLKAPSGLARDLFAIGNDRWSDLTLRVGVGDQKLKVHKVIVCARSPVLAAILDKKPSVSEIHIPGVDFDTMQIVVRYMYTDIVDNIKNVTLQIYPVARKYHLSELKTLCEKNIEEPLTVEEVAQTLV